MNNKMFITGCVHGFLAVALGAFGAHVLKERITEDMLDVYQTGVQYQMFHAIAIFVVAFACLKTGEHSKLRWAGGLFNAGIVLFSGSLYVMAMTDFRALGAITPLGGVCFLAGWTVLAVTVWKRTSN